MARDLPLGNGYLLVDFDLAYNLRDVYYDRAGQPNHAAGRVSRFGVWTAYAGLSWLGGDWLLERRYQPQALVTDVRATRAPTRTPPTAGSSGSRRAPAPWMRSAGSTAAWPARAVP